MNRFENHALSSLTLLAGRTPTDNQSQAQTAHSRRTYGEHQDE